MQGDCQDIYHKKKVDFDPLFWVLLLTIIHRVHRNEGEQHMLTQV